MIDVQRAGRGRPLRFVAAVGIGWISVRATFLWSEGGVSISPAPWAKVRRAGPIGAVRKMRHRARTSTPLPASAASAASTTRSGAPCRPWRRLEPSPIA